MGAGPHQATSSGVVLSRHAKGNDRVMPQAIRSRLHASVLSARLLLFSALALMLWIPVLSAQMPVQPAGSSVEMHSWIDDLRTGLGRYIWAHPDLPLGVYLETLTIVRESVDSGDRRTVKREMDTYFRMLAMHAQGISDAGAKELSASAVRLTPFQAYGISVPASLH